MRMFTNASYLFKAYGGMSDISVFNGLDAATGAPSLPATGAPQRPPAASEGNVSLDSLKIPVEDIQQHISTLQQMGASQDADQQQGALESKLHEFKRALDAMSDSCQTLIIKYRQTGVPDINSILPQDASQQGTIGTPGAPGVPGVPGASGAPWEGEGGLGISTQPAMPSIPMGEGVPGPMGAEPAMTMPPVTDVPPAGASRPGMTTFDDLTQQNKGGVTGRGGSSAPF